MSYFNSKSLQSVSNKTEVVTLLPHNQEMFSAIVERINEGYHSIFYSEATGLGKSFIFMKLIEDYFQDKKVLYIAPKLAIWSNLQLYSEFKEVCSNVDMSTNAAFNDANVVDLYASIYDVVFIDEAHHLESDVQGPNIVKLINKISNKGGFVFGMTATPYVKGIFIDEKYFETSVYGNNMADAIVKGLFPKIRYELGVPEIIEVPDDVRLQYNIDSTKPLLEQIIDEHKDIRHWLAFFTTTDELEENEVQLRKLFPGFKIFKMHSAIGQSEEELNAFNEYEGNSILMSVSMLLEGVHPKHCEGALLYRNVVTDNTMIQIIGRLCKANSNVSPLFVDITNSIVGIKSLFADKRSARDEYNHVVLNLSDNESRKEVLVCSQKTSNVFDLMQVLEQTVVHEYRGIKWTSCKSLSLALGVGSNAVNSWVSEHGECEDYIDYKLKDSTYEEYVKNGYLGLYMYGGYKWSDVSTLANVVGVSEGRIYSWLQRHKDKSTKDWLIYYLSKLQKESISNEIISQGYTKYKGQDVSSLDAFCADTGISKVTVKAWLKSHPGEGLPQYYDKVVCRDMYEIYKGFNLSSVSDVLEQLGLSFRVYKKDYADLSLTELIDRRLGAAKDRQEYEKYGRKTVYAYKDLKWTSVTELRQKLNVSQHIYEKWKESSGNDCGLESFIDYVDENNLRNFDYNTIHMRNANCCLNVRYTSYKDLAKKLAVSQGSCEYYMKKNNCEVQDYITYRFTKLSKETGVSFSDLNELAVRFETNVDEINNWLDENNASIKEYIESQLRNRN